MDFGEQIKKLRNLKRGAELAKSEKRDRIKVLEVAIKEHDKSSRRKDTQHNKTDRFYIKNTLFYGSICCLNVLIN